MFKVISRGFAATVTLALSGCAGVPQLDIQSRVTVANIIDRIQCEAYNAVRKNPKLRSERWAGAADLYLTVDDSAGISPSLAYLEPLATAGTSFAFGVSGNVKKARQRVYNESITFEMAKLNKASCQGVVEQYDLTGELGIEETLDIAAHSFDGRDEVKFADKAAVGQTLQFILTRNISGGPTWVLKNITGVGTGIGAERIDTHKLFVSFAPGAAVKTVVKDGVSKTVFIRKGGAGAAQDNNNKLLLNSITPFSIR